MNTDTPETDEQINGKPCTRFSIMAGDSLRDALVPSEFARKLERERDEAREAWREMHSSFERSRSEVEKLIRERDEAREDLEFRRELYRVQENYLEQARKERDEFKKILSRIYRWIERNHQDGFLDSLTYEQNLERIHDSLFDRIAAETDNADHYRELYEQLKNKRDGVK